MAQRAKSWIFVSFLQTACLCAEVLIEFSFFVQQGTDQDLRESQYGLPGTRCFTHPSALHSSSQSVSKLDKYGGMKVLTDETEIIIR